VALAKNPNIRTKSVGELAKAVGSAYGLEGDIHTWARTPQSDLAQQIADAATRMPPPKAALEAAADPFAVGPSGTAPLMPPSVQRQAPPSSAMAPPPSSAMAPPPSSVLGSAPIYQPPPAPYPNQPIGAYDDAVAVAGLSDRPQWLIPVVVGLAALVVGGGLAIMLAR
jgi:hypothetical protein